MMTGNNRPVLMYLAGPQAVGKWYGWQNGFANTAGVIGPWLTGLVLQHTGTFLAPFVITAAICVLGVIAWVWIVGRVESIQWSLHRDPMIAPTHVSA